MEKWAGILCCLVYICILVCCPVLAANGSYPIDPSGGLGRQFDGIGGLSGGGATSKLLVNYAEPYRSQILDYLFKPNFGASLHILKVEIGGDGQSTDGTESSHMHESWDENYKRGYEWWLMVEAKKRNPNIKLYGLSWAFPGWVSNGTGNPYSYPELTATYTTKWIIAAKKYYDLTIDYIGIWNERNYDINYVKVLRKTLDQYGQQHVQISVADTSWGVAGDILKDPSFAAAVDIIGAHYPGTYSTSDAVKTGKPLWAAEDYSTFNDNVGGGCWARLLNRNYVNGMMTSTISWNLIASYYESLPFGRDGLMTAESPWSGSYVVESPIWISAHTTQFTQIGWKYLQHDSGVGHLDMGGTYVSLVSPDNKDFTMVVETMTHNHSICIRPPLKPYDVKPQKATFMLKGALGHISQLNVWYTKFTYDGSEPTFFKSMQPVQVTGGQFGVFLDVDVVYTFTTVNTGVKGSYPDPPPSKPFPLPYRDNFESYTEYSEAYNMVPQVGVWEVRTTSDPSHSKVNRQVMLNMPVRWCGGTSSTINIIGNNTWSNIYVSTDAFVPSVNGSLGAMVGARVSNGGCGVGGASGVFFWVFPRNHTFKVTSDMKFAHILIQGNIDPKITLDSWFTISVMVNKDTAEGYTGSTSVFKVTLSGNPGHGYAAVGTVDYGLADFDNFSVTGIEPVVIRDIPKK